MIKNIITELMRKMGRHPIMSVTVIILLISGSFLFFTDTGKDFVDGIGSGGDTTNTLTTIITDTRTGDRWEGTIDLDETTTTQSIFGGKSTPLTALSTTIQGIEPGGTYTMEFIIKSTVAPEEDNVAVSMTGVCSIYGESPFVADSGDTFHYGFYSGSFNSVLETTHSVAPNEQTTYSNLLFNRDSHGVPGTTDELEVSGPIMGTHIDGSVFHIDIVVRDVATGGFDYYGTTEADLTLSVDFDGNMIVTIDDVDIIGG